MAANPPVDQPDPPTQTDPTPPPTEPTLAPTTSLQPAHQQLVEETLEGTRHCRIKSPGPIELIDFLIARRRSSSLPPPYSASLLPEEVEKIRDKYYYSTPTSKRSRTRSGSKIRTPRARNDLCSRTRTQDRDVTLEPNMSIDQTIKPLEQPTTCGTFNDPEQSPEDDNPSGNTLLPSVTSDIALNNTHPPSTSAPKEDEENSERDHLQIVQDLFSTRCKLTKETFEQTVNSMSKTSLDACLTAESIHTKSFLKKATVSAKREKLIAHCVHGNNPFVRIADGTVDIVLRATLIANVRSELGTLGADQTGDASECKRRLASLLKGSASETSANNNYKDTETQPRNNDHDSDTKEALSSDRKKGIRLLAFDLTTDRVDVRESLTNAEVNQALDHHMGKELNFLRGDSQAATTALAKVVSNMLETEEDQEDTHVGLYFLNGECTGIRVTHLDLSLEPDIIKSDVCILLGLDKHNSSDIESIEPTVELCDTLKTKGRTENATNCSHSSTPETGIRTTPTIATPEKREPGLLDKEDAKELLEELVEANKEIKRLNNYSASKRELWKNAMTRSTGLSPSTTQELVAQMSKKQLTIEIHRLGADYPVKSDQKASKKAAIKLLRKLLKEEHESQEPLERRSKVTEETEITRLTAENKRLKLYVETMNRERRPPKVTYAIDLGTQTTPGQEETSKVKHAEADQGSPKKALDKGSQTEGEDTPSQQIVAAVPIANTVAQDLKEREVNKVPTPELDKAQEEEKQQKYTSSHPYAEHQQWRGTPTDPMEALQQQYYSLHQRLQRIEDMHVGLESSEHMPPEQEEEEIPHTPPTADQSTSPRQGIPTLQQEEPQPQHSEKAHMSTPTRPRIRASSLDADHNTLIPAINQGIELRIHTPRKTQVEVDKKQVPARKGTTTEPAAQSKQKHSVKLTKLKDNKIPRHDAKVALMISDNNSSFRHEGFSSKVTTKPINIDSVTDLKTEKTRREIFKEPKVDFIVLDIPCDAGAPDQIAAYAAAIEDLTAYLEDRSTATIIVLIPITETLAEQNSLCDSISNVAKGHRTSKLKILNNATLYDKSTGLPKEKFQGDLKRLKGTCFNQLKRWFHSLIDPVKAPLSADKRPAVRRRRFPRFMVFSNPQHAKNDLPKAQAQAPNNGPTNSGTQEY